MPRNAGGVFSKPAGTTPVVGDDIDPVPFNLLMDDFATDANTPRPIVAGGTGASTADAALLALNAGSATPGPGLVPAGAILLWSGSIASVPTGWALCDGTSGTPDLRDRFIVGAGSTYAVAATGGANSVTLAATEIPSHTHSFSGTTASNGLHSHTLSITRTSDLTGASSNFGNHIPSNSPTGVLVQDYLTQDSGSHTHSFSGTTGSAGSGASHENRPPYYALAYIMKL